MQAHHVLAQVRQVALPAQQHTRAECRLSQIVTGMDLCMAQLSHCGSDTPQAMVVLALDGVWFAYDFIQEQLHKGAP